MNPDRTINLMRALFLTFATCVGGMWADRTAQGLWVGVSMGMVFGLVTILIDRLLKGFRLRAFSSATFGLLLGLFFATLLRASHILEFASERTAWTIYTAAYCFFGYLGMMLAVRSNRDEFALLIPYVRFRQQSAQERPLLVDTNIIIDGRIAAICGSGFLHAPLIVPRFVLDELHRLADSSDPLKRERGRRGLATLNEMQESEQIGVSIHESGPSHESVDLQLLCLARVLDARLVSNDLAVCQVARLQKINVINLNELTVALQCRYISGEELDVHLIKEGRDHHQAVGYQPDGTMVVVNHARHLIGRSALVVVSSLIQTGTGRLVFAELQQPKTLAAA